MADVCTSQAWPEQLQEVDKQRTQPSPKAGEQTCVIAWLRFMDLNRNVELVVGSRVGKQACVIAWLRFMDLNRDVQLDVGSWVRDAAKTEQAGQSALRCWLGGAVWSRASKMHAWLGLGVALGLILEFTTKGMLVCVHTTRLQDVL